VIDYREALGLEDGIPGVIRDRLCECPETASGERRVFRWLFYMVNRLLPYCSSDKVFELLQAASADCGRNTDSDILGAIKVASGYGLNSTGGAIHSSHTVKKKSKAPAVDYSRVVELYRKHGGNDALLKFCGTTPDLKDTRTLVWLCDLYGAKDNLCLGVAPESVIVAPLELWGCLIKDNFMGLCQEYCFLTPNPFKPDAERRCDAAILERRYFVLEGDIIGTKTKKDGSVVPTPWQPVLQEAGCSGWDLQAGIIFHLFELGYPIVSIVHSGGKSLHVWCSARGLTEDQIREMIAYAAGIGADDNGKKVSQFMRLPNPEHGSRKQHLIYHNPNFINK
jgi:hypothetical protein